MDMMEHDILTFEITLFSSQDSNQRDGGHFCYNLHHHHLVSDHHDHHLVSDHHDHHLVSDKSRNSIDTFLSEAV